MRGVKSWVFFFTALLFSLVTSLGFFSPNANAVSIYDNPSLTDTLTLTNYSCEPEDVTYTAFGRMDAEWAVSGYSLYNSYINDDYYWGMIQQNPGPNNSGYNGRSGITFIAVKKTITSGYHFGYVTNNIPPDAGGNGWNLFGFYVDANVNQYSYNVEGGDIAMYTLTKDNNCNDNVVEGALWHTTNMYSSWTNSEGIPYSGRPIGFTNFFENRKPTGGYGYYDTSIFYMNMPFNPPSGYEGEVPSQSSPVNKVKLAPEIAYDIQDYVFSFQNNLDLPKLFGSWSIDGLYTQIDWTIEKWDDDGGTWNTVVSERKSVMDYFTFDVRDFGQGYGEYRVKAMFFTSGIEPEGYTYTQRILNLPIDGSYFNGVTNDLDCDTEVGCHVADDPYIQEQCDLLNIPGCVNNALHALTVWLGINKTSSNPSGSPFVSFRTDSYGLLSIVTAPMVAINALTSSSCSPITLTLPYVEKTITLPCYYSIYQSNLGSLFVLYQTIATGVIGYYVIVGTLRTVKDIKDPKKDQIEVVQL